MSNAPGQELSREGIPSAGCSPCMRLPVEVVPLVLSSFLPGKCVSLSAVSVRGPWREDEVCACTHTLKSPAPIHVYLGTIMRESWLCHCQNVLAASSTEVEQYQDKSRQQIS